MADSRNFNFFLDKGPNVPGIFLFTLRLDPKLRPQLGDSVTSPLLDATFKIIRDVVVTSFEGDIRVTDGGLTRVSDDGLVRKVDGIILDPNTLTRDYFLTPADNPNRISSYTTANFANDQTLKQLFK